MNIIPEYGVSFVFPSQIKIYSHMLRDWGEERGGSKKVPASALSLTQCHIFKTQYHVRTENTDVHYDQVFYKYLNVNHKKENMYQIYVKYYDSKHEEGRDL